VRQKLIEYLIISFAGLVVTLSFAYFRGKPDNQLKQPVPVDNDSPTQGADQVSLFGAFVDYNYTLLEKGRWFVTRFWKISVGIATLMLMEVIKDLGQHGTEGFSLERVLRLASFRDACRRFVRGHGFEPMPKEDEDVSNSGAAPPQDADAEALAAAAYANERISKRVIKRLRVDHLVCGYLGDLESAMDEFEEATGVRPTRGGSHPNLGTHNAIVSLGNGAYFEILCRDPDQPEPPKLWMGMGSLGTRCHDAQPSALLTWAVDRAAQVDETVSTARANGYDPGDPEDFSRKKPDGSTLRWRLSYRHYTVEEMGAGGGVVPFLIDWRGSASPAASAPAGCELVGLRAEAEDALTVGKRLRALGISPDDLQLKQGERDKLIATLRTPKGVVEFQ